MSEETFLKLVAANNARKAGAAAARRDRSAARAYVARWRVAKGRIAARKGVAA